MSDELDFVDQNKAQIIYKKGETLCKKGTFATSIIYIVDGLVKVYLEGPSDKKLGVTILKSGDFIGLTSLFGNESYYYTSSALAETQVCIVNKQSFTDLIYKNSKFGAEIIKWYCKNYGNLFNKLDSFGFKHLNGRVADLILDLKEFDYKGKSIYSILTRRDIADMAGIPVGSALRILSEFSDAGIIELKKKEIVIQDLNMLTKISRGG
ncbi:MAG: Crp/Fnr family transcriptional regulator [Bacteroidales bacterium]|nr:Crp/Fnr family transcriptional regulator [Bacteroidales bacterium]